MIQNVVPFVHKIINETVSKNDICIDATCGNGHDTLFLSKISKFVYGFDIQERAIKNTTKLLNENNQNNFQLIQESHENISKYITDKIKIITFNLGYLPGSDKSILTTEKSTVKAIEESLKVLDKGGIITIILYIGHSGGLQEANHVERLAKNLSKSLFKVVKYSFINQVNSPFVLIIEKQ